MRIGIGSYAYRWSIGIGDFRPPKPLTPLDLLERAAALGADIVQYADNMPLDALPAPAVETIAQAAEAHGVAVQLGTHGLDPGRLRPYLALALTLRAGIVRVTPSAEDMAMPRRELLRVLAGAGDAFAAAGSRLALENHFLLVPKDLAALVAELDHAAVGVCLDVANSIANGEWPQETVERLAPYAVNLHIKDYRFELDPYGVGLRIVGAPLGEGRLDAAGVLLALAGAGREVDAIVEHWIPKDLLATAGSPRELEDAWTARSIDRLRTLAGGG